MAKLVNRLSLVFMGPMLTAVTAQPLWGQCHNTKVFTPSNTTAFGTSLEIEGTRMIVGATGAANTPGVVHVFEGPSWAHTASVASGLPADDFGRRVSLDGDQFLTKSDQGTVYVFTFTGSSWQSLGTLDNPDTPIGGFYGGMDIDGEWIAAGNPFFDDGSNTAAGAVYLFRRTGSTWTLFQRLTPIGVDTSFRLMGVSLILHGDELIVGVPNESVFGGQGSGVVSTYEFDGANWNLAQTISPPSPERFRFGSCLDRDGDELIVVAPDTAPDLEQIFAFDRAGGSWVYRETLRGPTGDSNWGGALSVDDGLLVVTNGYMAAAWRKDGQSWKYAGMCRAHDRLGGYFPADGDLKVAVSDQQVFAGATRDGFYGSVYILDGPTEWSWAYCQGEVCPCGNNDRRGGGCKNSARTGTRGAVLDACGSASVAADDLVLTADLLPPNQSGIFFMGGDQIQVPFGDGLLCVGSGVLGLFRYLPPVNSGVEERVSLGPGIVARSLNFSGAGPIDPGETWNFQFWYRDSMGHCGSGFNLSNARAILFQP